MTQSAGTDWTANPTTPADCVMSRPGPGRTDCNPCGGTVPHTDDPQEFLSSSSGHTMPFLGRTDLDQDPTTPCAACGVRGRYAPLAYHNPLASFNICPDCESGTMDGDNNAATACEPCDAGTYAPPGQECAYCARGKFDHDLDPSTECQQCAPGTVAELEKLTECTICNPGQYTDDDNWMCKDCIAGWYDDDSSAGTPCLICVAGSETVRDYAAIVCSQCISGRYSPINATVSCIDCGVGQYSPHNAIYCEDCQPGYADMVRDPSVPCEACNVGDYTAIRALNCTACLPGTKDEDSSKQPKQSGPCL
jgi:hypothetical protein